MVTKYLYSTGTSDIGEAKNFPWEYRVPDTEFFDPSGFKVGSTFLACFSEEEAQDMGLESKLSLSKTEKLALLLQTLQDKLKFEDDTAKPLSFYQVNYDNWRKVVFSTI
ncbi:uncharacterized protein LY89DRAFT_664367 [Mollisia scopiformis]|uniref:Uncharacterized protein n=1 Tax=Mollisia scopiformis TaxID=149040 RepID=A0A194XS58_MOLSC|nr:uncharacterized protein LY89DRAFT_664367 [Mollisia scopiformis]KUJ22562.1 hypothetical protein LY89DRAFT_664367 [Mollisia scopiformis]